MESSGLSICFTLLTVLVYATAMLSDVQPSEPEPTKSKTTIPPHFKLVLNGDDGQGNDDSHAQLSNNNTTNSDENTDSADETESKSIVKSERALGCSSGDASTSKKPESLLPVMDLPGAININPGVPYIIRIVIPSDNYRTNVREQPDGTTILDFISSPPSKSQPALHSGRNIQSTDQSLVEPLDTVGHVRRSNVPSSGYRPMNMMTSDQNTRPPSGNIDVLRMEAYSNPNSRFLPTNVNPQSGQTGNAQNFLPNPMANYPQPSNTMPFSYNEAQPQAHRYAPTYQQSDYKSYPNSPVSSQRSTSPRSDVNVPLNMGQVDTISRDYPAEVPRMEMVLNPESQHNEANGGRNIPQNGQGVSKGMTAPDNANAEENPAVGSVRNSAEPNNIRPGSFLNFGQPRTSEQLMGPDPSGNEELPSDGRARQFNEGFNRAPGNQNVDNTNPRMFGSRFSSGYPQGQYSFPSSGSNFQGQYSFPASGSTSQGQYFFSQSGTSTQGPWSSPPSGYNLRSQPLMPISNAGPIERWSSTSTTMSHNGNNLGYTVPQPQNSQAQAYPMARPMSVSPMSQLMSVSSMSQPMSFSPMSVSYSSQPTMSDSQRSVAPMEISPILKAFSPTVRNITHVAQAAPTLRTVSRALGDSDENNGDSKST